MQLVSTKASVLQGLLVFRYQCTEFSENKRWAKMILTVIKSGYDYNSLGAKRTISNLSFYQTNCNFRHREGASRDC